MNEKIKISVIVPVYNVEKFEAIVLGVAHVEFLNLSLNLKENVVVYDVKGVLESVDGCL